MDKVPYPKSCEECYKTPYHFDKCPYEIAVYLNKTIQFFKRKYDIDLSELYERIEELRPQAAECMQRMRMRIDEINREIEETKILRERLGIDKLEQKLNQIAELLEKKEDEAYRKRKQVMKIVTEEKNKKTGKIAWRTWRSNISEDKVDRAIAKLKEKYPMLSDNDIQKKINKRGNYVIMFNINRVKT